MKIAVNTCFGGFCLDDQIAKKYGLDKYEVSRTDPKLIELIESGIDVSPKSSYRKHPSIALITIPDEATDYRIFDYDGLESIIYVLDGKMYNA